MGKLRVHRRHLAAVLGPDTLQRAYDAMRAAGIFMATAAGNSGPSCSSLGDPPGIYDSAISVGATSFRSNFIASFSSRGPVTADGSGSPNNVFGYGTINVLNAYNEAARRFGPP